MIRLRIPIWAILILILSLIALTLLSSGCGTVDYVDNTRYKPAPPDPYPHAQNSCDFISTEVVFFDCQERAKAGDANAAFNIARLYDPKAFDNRRSFIQKDGKLAFYWYKVAADSGNRNSQALQTLFESYYFGTYGPENKKEAERYLKYAAEQKHQWAMLVLAHRSEKQDSERAMSLFMELAIKDNCHAQRSLARIYFEGTIVPQNLCKSYFWALLAGAGGFDRHSENHFIAGVEEGRSAPRENFCSSVIPEKYNTQKELGSKYIEMVQDAATRWAIGQGEPDFPLVQSAAKDKPFVSKIKPPDLPDSSTVVAKEKPLKWTPAQIDLSRSLTSNLTTSEVFKLVNPSVWTVIAASSAANLKAMNDIALGSAVAISENKLLTNYHLIEDRPYVVIKYGERFESATIISEDKQTDRCILNVANVTLKPAEGIRKYSSLLIGETVYSVGSPKGLENTLGQGIISGKREFGKVNLIQTTAQISKGSSGGGLFDRFGNLIGITTFKVVDSEGLNFAVAIEDFTK
ncbi:MAG: trypsin-like peptidase domain-containing protein [Deltaproteobacteria bacterium]